MLEKMYQKMESGDYDICACTLQRISEDGRVWPYHQIPDVVSDELKKSESFIYAQIQENRPEGLTFRTVFMLYSETVHGFHILCRYNEVN